MESGALLVWKRERPQKARIQNYDHVNMPEIGAAPVGNKDSREPDCRIGVRRASLVELRIGRGYATPLKVASTDMAHASSSHSGT